MTSFLVQPIPQDLAERRVAISDEAYASLFLDETDFGTSFRQIQNTRRMGPDPDDWQFARFQGIACGMAIWQAEDDKPIWRVNDIRLVFPTCWQASAYHAARLLPNSEGAALVNGAPEVGSECCVFGGTGDRLGLGVQITNFYYVFRVGRVVVKLYIMQSINSPEPLTPEIAATLARRVGTRAANVQTS
jgi:hypothetical protein